ncbi:TetR/AcrR family transcriptional regulator [Actinotalea solisilvae]|uniref:TetR/AcrR family transcriptional regulator n=1 Tax=Actinotalea solisilvae TaxID=2072922 RepID=UPI0018F111AC|nr:TetR/AcrR family transcriptional regulator [Actinotalea solisilvae]
MTDARPRTPRERARAEFERDLLAAARRHLATDGPAQLSLRAIARELGVASSAVYRYVESRDALLTALIVEAYDAAGEACERALDAALARGASAGDAWLDVARAFRAWARAHPHQFSLVYGTPVPGYAAPRETVGPAVRVWGVVARVLVAGRAADEVHPPRSLDASGLVEPGVLAVAAAIARGRTPADAYATSPSAEVPSGGDEGPVDAGVLAADVTRSVTLFAALVGAVTAELFGHLHNFVVDLDRVFDVTTATAAVGVGLDVGLDAGDVAAGGTAPRPAPPAG